MEAGLEERGGQKHCPDSAFERHCSLRRQGVSTANAGALHGTVVTISPAGGELKD